MMRIRVLALLLLSFSHSSFAFEDEIETFFRCMKQGNLMKP